MALKITRIDAGLYHTTIHDGDLIAIGTAGTSRWHAWRAYDVDMKDIASGKTKKEVISRLETFARLPQDRTVSDTLKLFRRSEIKKHTQLTVEGIRGKCSFISYTRKDDGSEWIDVITSQLQSRTVRPERVKRVHRTKSK